MNKNRCIKTMALGFLSAILLNGCYDKTETEDRRYVVLIGIDSSDEVLSEEIKLIGGDGDYILSLGEAELQNDIGDNKEDEKTEAVSGNTIPEIKELAEKYSDKNIYFGQLKAVIIGRELIADRKAFEETVYNIERMEDINTKVVVFVSDKTAADALDAVMKKKSKGGLYLWDYYKNSESISRNDYMDFESLISHMREEKAFFIPKIEINDKEVLLEGGVVIKDGKYVADISDNDIKTVKWLNGKAEGDRVFSNDISARVKRQTVSLFEENGRLIIDIHADCAVESAYGKSKLLWKTELERVIKENIMNTIETVVETGADFTEIINENTDVVVNAEVKIVSSGVIK